ncbi:MAG: DUF1015 family protein [Pseudomonadota bacterium]|nr:DUF1015 family protein [Pseudomonadota bacterium]
MKVTPFCAIRPNPNLVAEVSALPYDVVTYEELKSQVMSPKSFFHVTRAEIDLPEIKNPYDQSVYEKSSQVLKSFLEKGWLVSDKNESFYIYQESFQGRVQTGLVALVSIAEYKSNLIKKHELTRKEKEQDRINHIFNCRAHTEPVFLTLRAPAQLREVFAQAMTDKNLRFNFTSSDGVTHKLWQVESFSETKKITELFSEVPCSYIADGHHRAAAASEVSKRLGNTDFLAVIFPHTELLVLPYHRVVKDHQGLGWQKIKLLAERYFDFSIGPVSKKHEFGVYVENQWLKMTAKKNICDDDDVIKTLDVHILQEFFLKDVFSIIDPRTDKNIDFIGGTYRGLGGQAGIEDYCQQNRDYIGLSLFATSIKEMMAVADMGLVMPPKSTWFEPKLRSGLFLYLIN